MDDDVFGVRAGQGGHGVLPRHQAAAPDMPVFRHETPLR